MRKNICIFFLLIMTISLCGCHGSKGLEPISVPETFDTSKSYEITFWAKNDSNKAQSNVYKKAIEDFQKLYPNIHISMKQYNDYSRIYNDVITNISTNTTPNICITYPDHIATYLSGINIIVPIDVYMDNEKYGLNGSEINFEAPTKDEIVPEYLNECKFEGAYYALPFMRSTEACYINKDFVNKLGYEIPDVLSWDFIWEVSEKAMEKNPDGTYKLNDQNVLIPFIYKSTDNMLISMLKQKDAGYSTSEGDIEIFNDTTTSILYEVASHAKTGAFSTFKISSYPANFLNAGQCIFAIDSTAGSTWMGSDAPLCDIAPEDLVTFETVVRPIPQYDISNPKMISQGPSLCIFNKEDPQEVLASWLFTQYLLTNEVQVSYSETEGYTPVTTKARTSPEYLNYTELAGTDSNLHYQTKMDATQLLLQYTSNTFVTPVFNGSASLRTAAGALIEDVTKSERRKINVNEDFIQKEYSNVTSLYRLDQVSAGKMEKTDLGPLPSASVILLASLCLLWIFIIIYMIIRRINSNK